MEKGRSAAGIADNKHGRGDTLLPVTSKKDVVAEKTDPDHKLEQGKEEKKGHKDSDAPGCPSGARQPEVSKTKKASEVENQRM